MAKTSLSLLAIAALPSLPEASRKTATSEASLEVLDPNATDVNWAHWEFAVLGVSCAEPDFKPFEGFGTHWPKCKDDAIEKAKNLAKIYNCKICDVKVAGKKPEQDLKMTSTRPKATVTCAANRINVKDACFRGNGEVGKVTKLNSNQMERDTYPGKECLPCPPECKECIFDSSITSWTLGRTQFKCVLKPQGDAVSGERCVKPVGVTCDECHHRKCSGLMNWSCDPKDFKTLCQFNLDETANMHDAGDVAADEKYRDYSVSVKSSKDKFVDPTPTVQSLVGPTTTTTTTTTIPA